LIQSRRDACLIWKTTPFKCSETSGFYFLQRPEGAPIDPEDMLDGRPIIK
jgi:hypothetical protein